ncbi:hypothetical protein [Phycicoccus sp. Soil748]|uniref:hypothetical protein n=1 Tax=Phycicoccus sp. Soil748 TaxID=1736397 RepID=UPI00070346EF|nr:hypothetical protein [Phycicoccus sp. Soil748]KRE53001.1 hypothetical protein ASG70_13645 [Phycicoccus sp. Soil748]
MSIENQLREVLSSRADEVDGPVFDPYQRVAGAVVTSRRRRRAGAVGAVAAIAAVAVIVPSLVRGDDHRTTPAKHSQVVPGPSDPRWNTLSTWPTRGGLATNAAFLTAVRDQFGPARILYAADLDTTRVVVAWSPESGTDGTLTMYSGPRGAAATDLVEVSSASGGLDDLVSLREHADNDSRLVVLAAPSVRTVGVSPTVRIDPDGTVTRADYRLEQLTDGVWSGPLSDAPARLVRVRVVGKSSNPVTLMGRTTRPDDGTSICLSCTGADYLAKAEAAMASGVATVLGVPSADAAPATVYDGPVDPAVARLVGAENASGSTLRLTVVDTAVGGTTVRSALLSIIAKNGTSASTIELSDGTPINSSSAGQRPFVLRGTDLRQTTTSAQVFAPKAASVQLVSGSPTIYPSSPKVPVVDGSARVTVPVWNSDNTPYEVASYDAQGRQLGLWPLDLASSDSWLGAEAPNRP